MPVIVHVTLPGLSPDQYDAVRRSAGWLDRRPDGGLCHLAWFEGGNGYNIDAWESAAAFEAFAADRLGPAMAEVGVAVEPHVTMHLAQEVYVPLITTHTAT